MIQGIEIVTHQLQERKPILCLLINKVISKWSTSLSMFKLFKSFDFQVFQKEFNLSIL